MQLLSDEANRAIEAHLAAVIDRHLSAPGLAPLREKIRDYVLAGGKRVRPQLVAWTYGLASGDESLSTATLDVAAGWELFHAFLLVHDDIIDDSAHRRGRPALHRELASLDSGTARFGANLGIVAGDLLFSAAMCLWHGIDLDDAVVHRDLLRLISRVACTTGFGQAIDICASHAPLGSLDAETLLREYHWKTAAYTFEGPMLSGAILAGLGERPREAISRFSLAIGQAYQLQNDLNDLAKPVAPGCDIMEGKRTLTLLQHRNRLDEDGRQALDEALAAIAAGDDDSLTLAEQLRVQLIESELATGGSQALITSLLADARAAIDDKCIPPRLRAGIGQMLAGLRQSYFQIPAEPHDAPAPRVEPTVAADVWLALRDAWEARRARETKISRFDYGRRRAIPTS